MNRRFLTRSATGLALVSWFARMSEARADVSRPHRIAIHVGGGDPAMMTVALHNIGVAAQTYADRNETVAIELVANGPGYAMLRADTSPVKALVTEVHAHFPFVVFSACQMSRRAVAKAEGKAVQDIPEVPEASDVASGVVRLNELQEAGWSYIRV